MAGLAVAIELNELTHSAPVGHPENAGRLQQVASVLERDIVCGRAERIQAADHGISPIDRVHDPAYVRSLIEICKRGEGNLDPDTYVTSGSYDAALSIVNALLSAIDLTRAGKCRHAFVLGRPPGHHAEYNHAMGFCLINNVAVGAQYALDACGVNRVAVVDFDVHHGNGTQHTFYDRSDVLFISSHRHPFYPGTGNAGDRGARDGAGFTLNLPLTAGAGDTEIIALYESDILPALDRYRPEMLLVSAGFDACYRDPLGGMNVTGAGYFKIGQLLREVANRWCDGRLVSVLEGGYDQIGNVESITQYLEGIGYE
jgi:acetoin utilization deacetylase AcuC-like enzyme